MSHPDSPVIVTHILSSVSMLYTSTDTSYIITLERNMAETFSEICGSSLKYLERSPDSK